MLPLGDRFALRRTPPEKVLPWGLVIPAEDRGLSHVGVVIARGSSTELELGARAIYSTRVDTFKVGDATVDLVEEASVIGWLSPRKK